MVYFVALAIALAVSFVMTPVVKKMAFKLGAVDVPKDSRRMHGSPIALLGGVAIIAGFLASLGFGVLSRNIPFDRSVTGLLCGIAVLLVCGYLDDKFTLRPFHKFLFQLLAAILYVWISEMRIDFLTNPFVYDEVIDFSPFVSWPLTVMWIVGITNAINFIDGLDGLAAGVSCISAISLFFISMSAMPITGNAMAPILTAALAGAALGFLPFNFNPAKIFMGETGAAFLGFTLAAVSVQGMLKSYAAISLAIPVLIIGLPIFDVAFAVLRRVARGRSPAQADRSHLHHKLIDMGLSQRQSVAVLYVASAVLGLCGVVFANKNYIVAAVLLILLPVLIFAFIKYFAGDRADGDVKTDGGAKSGGDGKINGDAQIGGGKSGSLRRRDAAAFRAAVKNDEGIDA
jgi:UDP-GlcNAc:undecaprenyl-phosphate GlcNAc-1-phosphate transferase